MLRSLYQLIVGMVLAFHSAGVAHSSDDLLDGLPPSVFVADGFHFMPVTPTVRDIQDYFDQNSGNVSDYALVNPTVMASPPGVDGHLFVGTQQGLVFHVTFERDERDHPVPGSIELVLDIQEKVSAAIDRGLIGMAVHPDFENGTGRLYLAYTHANGDLDGYYETTCFDETLGAHPCTDVKEKTAGLAWYQFDDYVGDPDSEQLILGKIRGTEERPSCSDYPQGSDCIYSDSGSHTVGGVAFNPDTGAVCVSTGDGAGFYQAEPEAVRAASMNNLSGKLLCVNPDTGLGLSENPYWTGDPQDFASRIVAYGLRNPYRFTFSSDGELIIYMVGWNQVESIYRIDPAVGGYAGWPCHGLETDITDYQFLAECDFEAPEPVTPAQYYYHHLPENDYQAAIVGAASFGSTYPAWLRDRFIVGDYRNDWVRILGTDPDTGLWFDEIDLALGTDPANPIELGAPVMFHNDSAGRIYMLSFLSGNVDGHNVGTIYEINYTDPLSVQSESDTDPEKQISNTARFTFEPVEGDLTFNFDCSESTLNSLSVDNPEGVRCRWDFHNGTRSYSPMGDITHQYHEPNEYRVSLSLIEDDGEVLSRASRKFTVTDPQDEASLDIIDIRIPQRRLFISESFEVDVEVVNNASQASFCALLDVKPDSSESTEKTIRRCKTLPTDATTVLSFPLFFTDPGDFSLSMRFHATNSDLPTAIATAYLGESNIGKIFIQNRSGQSNPASDVTTQPENDGSNALTKNAGKSSGSSGGITALVLLLFAIRRHAFSRTVIYHF